MTPTPDIIAFRRGKKGGTRGQPWEDSDGHIHTSAYENWKRGYTLERIENPVLLTLEMVEIVRIAAMQLLYCANHIKACLTSEALAGHTYQVMHRLESAFASVLNPPVPAEPEKTTREKIHETIGGDFARQRILADAIDALARRVADVEWKDR